MVGLCIDRHIFPRKEPQGSISYRENFAPGSKRGRIANRAGLYLLLASFFVSNVMSINLHTTGLQAAVLSTVLQRSDVQW